MRREGEVQVVGGAEEFETMDVITGTAWVMCNVLSAIALEEALKGELAECKTA